MHVCGIAGNYAQLPGQNDQDIDITRCMLNVCKEKCFNLLLTETKILSHLLT